MKKISKDVYELEKGENLDTALKESGIKIEGDLVINGESRINGIIVVKGNLILNADVYCNGAIYIRKGEDER